jgi:hypothetical protein
MPQAQSQHLRHAIRHTSWSSHRFRVHTKPAYLKTTSCRSKRLSVSGLQSENVPLVVWCRQIALLSLLEQTLRRSTQQLFLVCAPALRVHLVRATLRVRSVAVRPLALFETGLARLQSSPELPGFGWLRFLSNRVNQF